MALGEESGSCTPYFSQQETPYGYVPSESAGITFVVIFGISWVLHTAQASRKRQWWMYVFAVGSMAETLGWAARVWSAKCPYVGDPFLMQLAVLILAPNFYNAGLYLILGRLINLMGGRTSPISASAYVYLFCSGDLISLVVQAIGGGIVANVINGTPDGESGVIAPVGNTAPGTNVLVAGILFQLATVAVFAVLFGLFCFRVRKYYLSQHTKALLTATAISTLMIYIRGIYRTVEMLQGWNGFLINHERYFIALDGSMMVICGGIFNAVHPGWFLDKSNDTGDNDPSF